MITQFRVQNYKALRDVTLNLTPIHLLIGPNDSGKTSLLEAMAALCRSVDYELPHAFGGRWEGSELVTDRRSQDPITLTAEVTNGERLRYEVSAKFGNAGRVVKTTTERIQIEGKSWSLQDGRRERFEQTAVCYVAVRGDPHAANWFTPPLESDVASKVHRSFSGVQLFRWNARLLSLPCALDRNAGFRMQSSGFGLARVLDAILGYDRNQFAELEKRFRDLFPSIAALRVLQTAGFKTQPTEDELVPMLIREDGKGIFVRFEGHEADIPAAHLSEGALLLLAYLAILFSPQPPRLLLVEEPENGIHPERLKEVIGILRELIRTQNHTQVVLTSHSPYIVSLFEPEEVTLCRKNAAGEVEVRRLSDSQIVREQSGVFSLGEIWPAEEDRIFAETESQESVPAEARP
jgi:predicted ATPase